MSCHRLVAFILVALVTWPPTVADALDEEVTVRIVPTSARGTAGSIELNHSGDHFHVVVTNNTKHSIKLWRDWCEWGYFNLSFEAWGPDGKISRISKRNRGWDKNFPDWTSLAGGENLVLDVSFDPAIWQNSPLAGPSGKATIHLRAMYQSKEDKDFKTEGIWAGQVSSPESEYSIYWMGENAKRTARRLRDLEMRDAAQPGVAADGAAPHR